jgi:hypothetical protein
MGILDSIPLPFGTSIGEVTQLLAAEVSLSTLMADPNDKDTMSDKVVDHILAIVMILVAKKRQASKA